MKVTVTVDGHTITIELRDGEHLIISDDREQLITFNALRLPALAAAFRALTAPEPACPASEK